MTRWAAFLGLTGVVLTLFLGLARLSQGAVRDPPEPGPPADGPDTTDSTGDGQDADATSPPGSQPEQRLQGVADTETGVDDYRLSVPQQGNDTSNPWHDPPGVAEGTPSLSTGALLANVAVTQGLFGGILAVGGFYFMIPLSALGVGGETLAPLAGGLGLGVVLWVGNELAGALADTAGVASDETLREMLSPESTPGWAVLFGVVLPVVALVEEFLFRAAVVGVPAAGFGVSPWVLVPVSAGVFALGHGAQGRAGVVVTGGLGLVLAGAYALTGSLLLVVVAHYLVNALEFLVHGLLDRPRLWSV